ncbi:MAG: alpha/beta hydrolase [Patescibacteria group bacterium]
MHSLKLFIVHGWAYEVDSWGVFLDELRKRSIEPIMLNVPGLTEPSDKVWDIDAYVDWLDSQIKGVKNVVVLGHSNGGRILLNYSIKHPQRLKKLILVNSAGAVVDEQRVSIKRTVLRIGAKVLRPLRRLPLLRRVLYRFVGASDYYKAPENMKQTLVNMLDSDAHLDLSQVMTHTAMIWGSDDTYTPLSHGRLMEREIPDNSGLYIMKGVRHAPYKTHPLELAAAVEEAMNR